MKNITTNRILSFAMAAIMAFGLAITPPITAQAAMPASTIGDVSDGVDFTPLSASGNGIYYGTYKHKTDSGHESSATPILWRVMGEEKTNDTGDNAITLMSEYVLDNSKFDDDSNIYSGSDIQTFLAGTFMDSFTNSEKQTTNMIPTSIVTKTYKLGAISNDLGTSNSTVASQQVYLPWGLYENNSSPYRDSIFWSANGAISSTESDNVNNTIYRSSDGTNYNLGQAYLKSDTSKSSPIRWWLRSPGSDSSIYALNVWDVGSVLNADVLNAFGVRPAFKLNPSSVIFTSEILTDSDASGKPYATAENGFYSTAAGGKSNFKLTVLDSGLSAGILTADSKPVTTGAHPIITTTPGGTIPVAATNASANTNLTYKIVKDDGDTRKIVGYGQGNLTDLSMTAKDLSGGNLAVGTYTVYVWAQKNVELNSNTGSKPQYFEMTVNTPPTVKSGASNQTGTATPAASSGNPQAISYTADVSAWFADSDSDTLTYSIVATGTTVTSGASILGNTLTYTPTAADVNGERKIIVKANDTKADSITNVTITVTVGAVPNNANNAPTVTSGNSTQSVTATPAASSGNPQAVAYSANVSAWFEDVDGDTLTYYIVSNDANGTANLNATSGGLTYTPTSTDASSTKTIVVKANDTKADSTGNVTISVEVGAIPTDSETDSAPYVAPTELSITAEEQSTFTVYLGTGRETATSATVASDDESVATISYDEPIETNSVITVTGVAVGETTISIVWSGGSKDGTTDTVDVTVTAVPIVTHTVTFNLNEGSRTSGGELLQTVADGTAATEPIVTRDGYTFDGWDNEFTNVIDDMTVTAIWTQEVSNVAPTVSTTNLAITAGQANTFTLDFGTGTSAATSATVASNNTNVATIDYNSPIESSSVITVTGVAAGDTTISIVWSGMARSTASETVAVAVTAPLGLTHNVTFVLNGGTQTGGGALSQTVANGASATPPTVSRDNYTFNGWDKSFTNVTANMTITANWSYNGGSGNSGNSGNGGGNGRDKDVLDETKTKPVVPVVTDKPITTTPATPKPVIKTDDKDNSLPKLPVTEPKDTNDTEKTPQTNEPKQATEPTVTTTSTMPKIMPTNAIAITNNGINYKYVQNPDNADEFFIYDEEGTPLGSITVPQGMTLADMNIGEDLVPFGVLGAKAKKNPKTGVDSNGLSAVGFVGLVVGVGSLLYIRKKRFKLKAK